MPISRAVALTGSDQQVAAYRCMYMGCSIRETAGSTAVVRIYDGTTAAGVLLETLSFASGGSAREYYSGGVQADGGIFVDIVSGSVEGSVRVG